MKKLILILTISILFISCRKDIIKVNSDYEGNWTGVEDSNYNGSNAPSYYTTLNIDSQSNLNYCNYSRGEKGLQFTGTAKIRHDIIHVRGILFGHSFTIISPPTKINSSPYLYQPNLHWAMKLKTPDGDLTFYRE